MKTKPNNWEKEIRKEIWFGMVQLTSEGTKRIQLDLCIRLIKELIEKLLASHSQRVRREVVEEIKEMVLEEISTHTSPHTLKNCTYCRVLVKMEKLKSHLNR